ncbi:hypothetical protein FACS18949_08650 [Clostridia bacterium]|nr:hypothetical protein FACS18949_08650 [Clostridia bacterium]
MQAAADFIPHGLCVVDVGSDHGKLAAYLAARGHKVIATDINPAPLEKCRAAVGELADCRLGDGLSAVSPGEVDAIVIAGMGGETIVDILRASPWSRGKICVLQPASKAERLRRFCYESGYAIERETVIFDAGRWCPVLRTRYSEPECPPAGHHFLSLALRENVKTDTLSYADKTIKWLANVLPKLRKDPRHAELAAYYGSALTELTDWRKNYDRD